MFVTNPYPDAHVIDHTRSAVESGESVEVTDEQAESLIAQGWTAAKSAKSRKEPSEQASPTPQESTEPAVSGAEKE